MLKIEFEKLINYYYNDYIIRSNVIINQLDEMNTTLNKILLVLEKNELVIRQNAEIEKNQEGSVNNKNSTESVNEDVTPTIIENKILYETELNLDDENGLEITMDLGYKENS